MNSQKFCFGSGVVFLKSSDRRKHQYWREQWRIIASMRSRACAVSAAVLGQVLVAAGFAPPAQQAPALRSARHGWCRAHLSPHVATTVTTVGRRKAMIGFGVGLVTTIVPQPSSATPVRAPLPPGPADPADWDALTKAASTVEAWGEELEEPAAWAGIAELVKKAPFTQESMDLMLRKAAKNLPANALLGSDAGYWAGVRVEV